MDSRNGLRSPGSRAETPAREVVLSPRVSRGQPANDNGAPLATRLAEAGKWTLLLALLLGAAAWLMR